jgi:hypothetical protein
MTERLSDDDREVLREVLTTYAKEHVFKDDPDVSDDEALAGAIELFERGLIRIWHEPNKIRIERCSPEEAPQLYS